MAIGIISGIIILVLTVVAFSVFAVCMDVNKPVGIIAFILGIALIISFILIPFSWHTVKSGQIAVVQHLGKIEGVRTAGTSFDLWVTNKYTKYDTKVQNLETDTMAYSSDAQTMDIQMTIQYQIDADKVVNIATQYGKLDVLESRIKSIAIEKAKSVLSSSKAMDIIANRAAISPAVEEAIMFAVDEEYYVDIVTVVLTNIDFSDAFELAVEEKMVAEQAKLKADYENDTKVAKAQTEIEIAKAKAEALMISAEAEAEANDIIEASITDKIIDKNIVDKWDGRLPNVVGGDSGVMLHSDVLG